MKRIVFMIFITSIFIMNVKAFEIDIDKININSRSNSLIQNLDKAYNIETPKFNKKIVNDEKAVEFAKKIVTLSFTNKTAEEKQQDIYPYMYISEDNGFDTLTGLIFIQSYLKDLSKDKIEIEYVRDIKTVPFNKNEIFVFMYLPDSLVNNEKKEVVLSYWLKKSKGEYKLYYPWLTIDDDLTSYFNKVTKREDSGNVIGGSYNSFSLDSENKKINDNTLQSIFDNNKNTSVQITGMNELGSNTYGSGFLIREGIVATTWSLFLQFLTDSNYIYVNDVNGNTYEITGVVAAQTEYDVVLLKLSSEVGQKVSFGSVNDIKSGDKIFTINSKNNSGFSINYGENISYEEGRLKNLFLLNNSDVGSALYNINGQVIGFNVADQLNSELSYANSTDYLKQIQNILVNTSFNDIKFTKLEDFKESYYLNIEEEYEYNNVSLDIWDKYKKIGNIEKNITLDLIKASYVDNILSLRYKNDIGSMIDSVYLISNFTDELLNNGYELSYLDSQKMVYKNNEYKIIIKNNLNYLIILIMEI